MSTSATRTVLLARPGEVCDTLGRALEVAGLELLATLNPLENDASHEAFRAADNLVIVLDAEVEDVLERFDSLLEDARYRILFEEANLVLARSGWDSARWTRHLSAKLLGHGDVLPAGHEPDETPATQPANTPAKGKARLGDALPEAGTAPARVAMFQAAPGETAQGWSKENTVAAAPSISAWRYTAAADTPDAPADSPATDAAFAGNAPAAEQAVAESAATASAAAEPALAEADTPSPLSLAETDTAVEETIALPEPLAQPVPARRVDIPMEQVPPLAGAEADDPYAELEAFFQGTPAADNGEAAGLPPAFVQADILTAPAVETQDDAALELPAFITDAELAAASAADASPVYPATLTAPALPAAEEDGYDPYADLENFLQGQAEPAPPAFSDAPTATPVATPVPADDDYDPYAELEAVLQGGRDVPPAAPAVTAAANSAAANTFDPVQAAAAPAGRDVLGEYDALEDFLQSARAEVSQGAASPPLPEAAQARDAHPAVPANATPDEAARPAWEGALSLEDAPAPVTPAPAPSEDIGLSLDAAAEELQAFPGFDLDADGLAETSVLEEKPAVADVQIPVDASWAAFQDFDADGDLPQPLGEAVTLTSPFIEASNAREEDVLKELDLGISALPDASGDAWQDFERPAGTRAPGEDAPVAAVIKPPSLSDVTAGSLARAEADASAMRKGSGTGSHISGGTTSVSSLLESRIASLSLEPTEEELSAQAASNAQAQDHAVVIMGGIGGPDPLRQVLQALPVDFSVPVLVQQWLDNGHYDRLERQMARASKLPVVLAEAGAALQEGNVYIVPAGMGLQRENTHLRFVAAKPGRFANLLDALAATASTAVVLSGAFEDFIDPLMRFHQAGGELLVQDEEGCYDPAVPVLLRGRGATAMLPAAMATHLDTRRHNRD